MRESNQKSDNSESEKGKVSPSSSHAARVVDSTASPSAVDAPADRKGTRKEKGENVPSDILAANYLINVVNKAKLAPHFG